MKQSRILIVEDQTSLRGAFVQILENAGFLTCSAEGYDQAIALIDSSIDLALLDVQLEGRSGLDILAYIRENHPDCPSIMISGYADKKNTIEALRQGAVEYLEKPISAHELVHSIKHWIDFRDLKQENQRLQDFQAIYQRLKANEVQIRMANERLNFLLTSTSAVIYASGVSEQFPTTFISDNIKRLCGYDAETFTSHPGFRLECVHPDDLEHVHTELERGLKRGSNRFEYRFQHKDGHYFWVGDEIRVEQNSRGEVEFLGFIADISQNKQSETKIRQMAYTDLLTGLPNRSLYYDRLKQAIAQSHRNKSNMAVLFMDLDYFKPINDELGHEWGDKALIEVATRLRSCIRETDTVARIGGDEFSMILGEIDSEESACLIAEKVINQIRKPMMLKGTHYVLGVSIGISLKPAEQSDAETIMRLADDAMYQAKEMGRNRYCIYRDSSDGMPDELNRELILEKALRQAIANHELVIYYQPKVDLKDGIIIGTHALLRWNRGDAGMVLPDQFLPLANRTGLIVPIGEWVLRHACLQNRAWQESGLPIVPVSVNITAEQLRHSDFSRLVASILDESKLPAEMLQLEISENDLMQHASGVLQSMNELNALGVKITIDNFGAGFFSLQALKAMPVHELKMNRSLINQIGKSCDSGQVANAIIAMGHILNHQVVAEGVETTEQLSFLREHDSDGMLGYLSSPPVPADEIIQQLKNRRSMLKA
ncbi:EAL domain-containing protein [Mariprofundus sp. KV]|uniref:two-component system response regulator n=1 Tax=Mariprofundus sp. KV TaxID=2608715 RepID=UPI0015A46A03|nr:EAL domain-containing protein [Mariprofundus sp. KV]NWF35302.1 EAL domain-containing protein [Mariprofundus sp. KV]